MRVLRYFILEREGEVVIERCQSDEIDATREAVEAARDALPSSPDGLIRLSW